MNGFEKILLRVAVILVIVAIRLVFQVLGWRRVASLAVGFGATWIAFACITKGVAMAFDRSDFLNLDQGLVTMVIVGAFAVQLAATTVLYRALRRYVWPDPQSLAA